MNHEVGLGSRVFIHIPGDYVLSGVLENYGRQHNSVIRCFHVQTPHGTFTANLQPFPVRRGPNSHQVDEYRCFIPISGNRVLAAFLEPHAHPEYIPGSIRVAIRFPEQNHTLYTGLLEVGEGEGPEWIPRHM